MAVFVYCWRCNVEVPMLSEEEWTELEPFLNWMVENIQKYRTYNACSLEEARKRAWEKEALDAYERITGFHETNVSCLYHHRLSLIGPRCVCCGKPLRTPKAPYCASCGKERTN